MKVNIVTWFEWLLSMIFCDKSSKWALIIRMETAQEMFPNFRGLGGGGGKR
jgi:hypothetical protein